MATATGKTECVTCKKEKVAYKCFGCLQNFCMQHLADHNRELEQELDEIEDKRNIFRQNLTEQKTHPDKQFLIKQVNQWEYESIKKIQQIAEETKELIIKYSNKYMNEIEMKLEELTKQLKETRQENDFNEIVLNQLKEKFEQLEIELHTPSSISIKQEASSFISKISIITTSQQLRISNISINAKWKQNGITVAGGNGSGNKLNQLCSPLNMDIDDDGTIYIAEYSNHRIVEWKKNASSGRVVAGGNEVGNRDDQLNGPINVIIDKVNGSLIISDSVNQRVVRWSLRNGTSGDIIISNIRCSGLATDNNGYVYVSDVDKHDVKRYKIGEINGTIVAGGNGSGNRLDQFNEPRYIFVDQDQSVYVSDSKNHRVMKWMKGAKEGIVVAGSQGQGNSLRQLSDPRGIIVDQFETVYVADSDNNRVIRWLKGAKEGSVVVCNNGQGSERNVLNSPMHLSFDRENNLYVADCHNERIQKFSIDSN